MKVLKFNSFIISLALFFIFVAVEASAATYYVAKTGNNTRGNGSEGSPWLTIQKGVDNLRAGDTLIVKDGTYTDSHGSPTKTVQINVSGASGNWITIKSENKWGAILDGQNETITKGFNFGEGVDYIRIEDFRIKQYDNYSISVNRPDISNIYIYGCNMSENGIDANQGTDVNNVTQYVTIDSCIMHDGVVDNTQPRNISFYLRGIHITVINNIFYNNKHGWEISLGEKSGGYSGPKHSYVANNIIYIDERQAPFDYTQGRSGGILLRNSYIWVENNIIIVPEGKEDIGGAINVYGFNGCEDELYFKNNLTNADNIWTEHDGSRQHACTGWPKLLDNLKNADPDAIFVGSSMPSATEADYKLQSGSPAIDAGKTPYVPDLSGGLTYDYRKTATRPQDSLHDIGAYEYIYSSVNSIKAPQGITISSNDN